MGDFAKAQIKARWLDLSLAKWRAGGDNAVGKRVMEQLIGQDGVSHFLSWISVKQSRIRKYLTQSANRFRLFMNICKIGCKVAK